MYRLYWEKKMKCEVCLCDPCDCEDMGLEYELWGMGPERNEWNGEIHPLADERNRSFHQYGQQMEERNQAQDRIFSEGVPGDFQREETSTSPSDQDRGFQAGD